MRRRPYWLACVTAVAGLLASTAAAQPSDVPSALPPVLTPNAPRTVIAQTGIPAPPAGLQQGVAPSPKLVSASAETGDRVSPITLGTALKLAGTRPLDVQVGERVVGFAMKPDTRTAAQRAAANDATLRVLEAYFGIQQARGELAGALLALKAAEELGDKSAAGRIDLARRHQTVSSARERWRLASADLVRTLRLDPGTLVEPAEKTFLAVAVIDLKADLETLLPIAQATRPEVAAQQAVARTARARLDREASAWFSSEGRLLERRAEYQLAALDVTRTQDRIASEVTVAFAQAKSAGERLINAEPALKEAVEWMARAVNSNESAAPAAVQLFAQANADFYAAVGDYNRAQFRLYRALGHPADGLIGSVGGPENFTTTATAKVLRPSRPTETVQAKAVAVPPLPKERAVEGIRLAAAVRSEPTPIAQTPAATVPQDLPVAREMMFRRPLAELPPTAPTRPTETKPTPASVPATADEWTPLAATPPANPGTSTPVPAAPVTPGLDWGKPKDAR